MAIFLTLEKYGHIFHKECIPMGIKIPIFQPKTSLDLLKYFKNIMFHRIRLSHISE